MLAIQSLRERWSIPTLEERVEQALGQPVLAAERAYRIHRFLPFAFAFFGSAIIATSVSQTVESAIFLLGWLGLWALFRVLGIFAIIAVTSSELVILDGLGRSLTPKIYEHFVPNLGKLDRPPQRIAVGGRNYRLTLGGWRSVLRALAQSNGD